MARHRHSRLRHRRRRPIGEVFVDAFGRYHKREGDTTKPSEPHRKTRKLTPIHSHIQHHRHSRLYRKRRRKPKLP